VEEALVCDEVLNSGWIAVVDHGHNAVNVVRRERLSKSVLAG
jgi:hypothetical protein